MTATDRRRIAIHEAGHGVAGMVLGLPVQYVSIRAGRTFAGLAVPEPHDVPDADRLSVYPSLLQPTALRDHVERRVVALLAGATAELYLGDHPAPGDYSADEAERIARDALVGLGPRLAELVVCHEQCEDTGGIDEAKALDLATAIVGPGVGALYLELLRHEAHSLVIRYAAAILRVADALERHAVLSGDQVAAIMKGA